MGKLTVVVPVHPNAPALVSVAGIGYRRARDADWVGCWRARSASGRKPGARTLGRREMLSRYGGQPDCDDIGVNESGIEQRGHEVLVLLAEGAELGDA